MRPHLDDIPHLVMGTVMFVAYFHMGWWALTYLPIYLLGGISYLMYHERTSARSHAL